MRKLVYAEFVLGRLLRVSIKTFENLWKGSTFELRDDHFIV